MRSSTSLLRLASVPLLLASAAGAHAQLRAGAGKVDITPPANRIIEPYTSIHDHIYTRAILLDDGGQRALLMNVDAGNIQSSFADPLMDRIAAKFSIPRQNILLSAVHIHSSEPSVGGSVPGAHGVTENTRLFEDHVAQSIMDAVAEAQGALVPAEIGFGTARLDLNVNRDAIDPKTRRWAQEANPEGYSDKTFAVVELRRVKDGTPLAVYMNYAMHAVTMFLRGDLSADFPGVASGYLESVYGPHMVAVWTQAAEGDQNPLNMRPILAINEERIHADMPPDKQNDPTEYNSAIMRLFFTGPERPQPPVDPKLMAESWQVVEGIGVLSAEAAIRAMTGIEHWERDIAIQGNSEVVSCPGRKRLDSAREGYEGHYADGPPAQVRIGAIRLGSIGIGEVNAEPYNRIGVDAREGSPLKNTMVVVLAAGGAGGGYIPDDASAQHLTFQALGSKFKPGCAETGIARGIDNLLSEDLRTSPLR